MKARWQIGFPYRTLYNYTGSNTFLRIYLSHVRPHLEYAAVVWDPHQAGIIDTNLKTFRNLFFKPATEHWKANYNDLLNICQTPSLEQSRQYLKLITLFKIYNGVILMPDAPVHVRPLPRILRNSQQLFLRPTAHTFSFDSSFFSKLHRLLEQAPTGCLGK